jgi:hypothetical protein
VLLNAQFLYWDILCSTESLWYVDINLSQGIWEPSPWCPKSQGSSWSWSYGSWIYNYLCNRCLSPLTFWFLITAMVELSFIFIISSHLAKGNVSFIHHLASIVSSVNFSHFNLLDGLPSFSSFGQPVSEEKIFKNRPIRNNTCLQWPCLLMDRDKMPNL